MKKLIKKTAKSALNLLNIAAYPLRYSDTSIKNTYLPGGNAFGTI